MSKLEYVNALSYENFRFPGTGYRARGKAASFARKKYGLHKRFTKDKHNDSLILSFFVDIVGNIWQFDKIYYKIDLKKYNEIIDSRIQFIKNENLIEDDKQVLQEYFVNLFSWSGYSISTKLLQIFHKKGIKKFIDPFASSGFHACLLYEGMRLINSDNSDLEVLAFDVQPEKELLPWYPVQEKSCFNLDWTKYNDFCLILSWADSDKLAEYCYDNFKGKYILSIGNYKENSGYTKKLNNDKLLFSRKIKMPWKDKYNPCYEYVKLYIKTNKEEKA